MPPDDIGRLLLVSGLAMAAVGAVLMLSSRIPWLGRLPGNITIEGENVTIYIPILASVLVSLLLTLVLNLLSRR